MKTLKIHCHNGDTWEIQYSRADFPDTLREMWAEQGKIKDKYSESDLDWYRIEEEKMNVSKLLSEISKFCLENTGDTEIKVYDRISGKRHEVKYVGKVDDEDKITFEIDILIK